MLRTMAGLWLLISGLHLHTERQMDGLAAWATPASGACIGVGLYLFVSAMIDARERERR